MSKTKRQEEDATVYQLRNFSGGLANFAKEDQNPNAYQYSQCLDTRTDPYLLTLLPATQKESGSVVTDLLKFADLLPLNLTTYAYGNAGNIYQRTTAGSWSLLHTVASSHGNGLQYFYGDDYLYYTGDMALGRYGPISSNPSFSDDFLTAQGGIPQNTYSLALVAASSQSADAVDSASLSITGDLTLEAYVNLNSLPAVGSSMSIVAKWDESSTTRSYMLDIYGISAYFGDGSDGSLTISSNTTQAPIDSACTGTAGATSLTATNASFVSGKPIFIYQTQGTNAGQWERNVIASYTAGTITLQTPLIGTYTTGAQVIQLKQYINVTVNTGVTWTAKAWNGTTGGVLMFLANGTLTVSGNISANACGFQGATAVSGNSDGLQGEGTAGAAGTTAKTANGNGGGGGGFISGFRSSGGGGGGNATTGAGSGLFGGTGTDGGIIVGSADLTTMLLGGGGGSGGAQSGGTSGIGGIGGGIVFAIAVTHTITGSITANGGNGGTAGSPGNTSGGGAGAAGSILLKAQTATLGSALISALGGTGGAYGSDASSAQPGGNGGNGYIVLDYLTSYTGSTSPNLNAIQDNTLVTTPSYQMRLHISSNGTLNEILTQNLTSFTTGQWNRLSVSWLAASSLATFYLNGSQIGTATGAATAINDNASKLYIGTNKGASALGNYLDGFIDDVRVWSGVQTAANIYSRNNHQLTGNEAGLAAYYELNNAATDLSSNTNTLTLRNAPSYSQSVPFVDATTRLDIDQQGTGTGHTYTLLTAISELAVNSLPFTPLNDPQKSVDFNISAKGTGNWTVTVHDQTNRVIASKTITNANLASSGFQEFIWDTPWRIVIGKSYHIHVTSTVGDGSVVTGTASDFSTVNYHTYFQFLVTDTFTHPIMRWLNFIAIGNERYIAKWDGAFYSPNLIAFPAGTHIRCFGVWGTYLAVGTWQEATSGTPNVYDFPTGKIYFWDGISLSFNFSIDVPEGQVNAIFGMDADLYYIAGWKADLMYYRGAFANQSGAFNGTKVKRVPGLEASSYIETYPQAMAMWQGLLYFGMGGNSDSTTFKRNIYSWGTLQPQYAQTLTSDHVISTGNNGSTVKIGLVYPVGKKLLIGWQDGIAYGADIIDPNGGVFYKSGYLKSTIQDGETVYHNDLLVKTRADHLPLTGAQGVTIGAHLDRSSTMSLTNCATDTSKRITVNPFENGRVSEYDVQVNLSGDGTSSPNVLAIAGQVNPLDSEEQF